LKVEGLPRAGSALNPQPSTLNHFLAWVVPVVAALALLASGCSDDDSAKLLAARRGDLEVQIALRGTLQAVQGDSIKSPRWGEIRRMAPNGSMVKAGDKVLELVSDDAESAVRAHRSDVEIGAAELRQARQEVASSTRAAEMRREAARLDRELQEANLKELAARPTERELTDASSRLALAKALLVSAEEAVTLVADLVKSGYAPQEDLRSAERDVLAAKAELAAAESNFETVKAGPTVSERQAAAVRLEAARLAEESATKNIQVNKEWGDMKLARFERRLEREKEKLEESERKLGDSTVACSVDGVVLYAPRRWGGNWQVGQQVWQGATVMTVPNLSRMKLTVQVPAERVREIEGRRDLAARVRVVALPGREIAGRLTRVSAIGKDEFENLDPATAEKVGRAERQVFEAEVELDAEDPTLRPGLSAEAQLVLRRVRDAVIVPLAALNIQPPSAVSAPPAMGPGPGKEGPAPNPPRTAPQQQPPPAGAAAGGPAGEGRRGPRGEGAGRGGRRTPQIALVYVRSGKAFEERTVKILARSEFEAAVEGPVQAGDLLYPGRPAKFVKTAEPAAPAEPAKPAEAGPPPGGRP